MKILKIIPLMILGMLCFSNIYNKPTQVSKITNNVKGQDIRDNKAIS